MTTNYTTRKAILIDTILNKKWTDVNTDIEGCTVYTSATAKGYTSLTVWAHEDVFCYYHSTPHGSKYFKMVRP